MRWPGRKDPLSLLRRLGVGAASGLLSAFIATAAQSASPPTFQQGTCELPGLTADLAPRLRCGTVAVPRDRASPQVGTFRLAVVVVKAADPGAAQADPVVYVAGGPGSPLTSRAALIARHEAGVVAPGRDLILVDQRGSGRSEPALCPGLARQQVTIFAEGAEQGALVRDWRETFARCRREMTALDLRPEWFGTPITATDFEDVRQALGIARWNVYALSYGTAVALTMLAQAPEALRAVVIDSVFPPDPLPMTLPETFGRALELLFAACGAETRCATAHPDLADSYRQAVRTLDAEALPIPLPAGLGVTDFRLRGELFRLIVDRALYSRRDMALLPGFIDAARDRDASAMRDLVGSTVQGYLSMSIGDMAAVECRDRPSWHAAVPSDDADPPVSAFVTGACADWSALGPAPSLAKGTQVPALVLAGNVDPITPPVFARQAAAGMGPMARLIEFAHVGHGVQATSGCGERVVSDFIRSPKGTIDASCAEAVPPIDFR